jgi:hypothetical protein
LDKIVKYDTKKPSNLTRIAMCCTLDKMIK